MPPAARSPHSGVLDAQKASAHQGPHDREALHTRRAGRPHTLERSRSSVSATPGMRVSPFQMTPAGGGAAGPCREVAPESGRRGEATQGKPCRTVAVKDEELDAVQQRVDVAGAQLGGCVAWGREREAGESRGTLLLENGQCSSSVHLHQTHPWPWRPSLRPPCGQQRRVCGWRAPQAAASRVRRSAWTTTRQGSGWRGAPAAWQEPA